MTILAGCGDDGGSTPPDAAVPDATQAADANVPVPDASVPAFDRTTKTQALSTGITMAYVETGNPSGEVVILMPGYTDSVITLFTTMEAFAASNTALHVYAIDLRGHGGSSMPAESNCPAAPEECFQMTDMADDLIAFMDAKNIATAHLVGHSTGGFVAQEVALAHPDRLESLLLTGTLVYAADNPAIQSFLIPQVEETWRSALEAATPGFQYPQDAYDLTPMAADPDIVNWVATTWIPDKTAPADIVADVVVASAETKLGTWIGALRGFATFDTSQRLEALRVRTLVMWEYRICSCPKTRTRRACAPCWTWPSRHATSTTTSSKSTARRRRPKAALRATSATASSGPRARAWRLMSRPGSPPASPRPI